MRRFKFPKLSHLLANPKAGFTLVELVVVIAILGILAGVGAVGYNGYIKKAEESADQQVIAAVNTAFAAACLEQEVELAQVTAADISLRANKMNGISSVTIDGVTDSTEASRLEVAIAKGFKLYYQGNEETVFKKEGINSLQWNAEKSTFETCGDHVDVLVVLDNGKVIKIDKEDMEDIQNSAYADMGYAEIAALIDNVGESGESLASIVKLDLTGTLPGKIADVLVANGLVNSKDEGKALSTTQTANGLTMVTAKYLANTNSAGIDELLTIDLGSSSSAMIKPMISGSGGTKTVSAMAIQYALVASFADSPEMADKTVTIYTPTKLNWLKQPSDYKNVTMTVSDYLASEYAQLDPVATMKAVRDLDEYDTYVASEQYQSDKKGFTSAMSILGDNVGTVSNPGSIDITDYLNNGIYSSSAESALTAAIGK